MGKHKYIETPERMWELFKSYKQELESNPINVVEQKKGNTTIRLTVKQEGNVDIKPPTDIVHLPHKRPLTLEGFENWCQDNEIISDLSHYFSNYEERYTNYLAVCSRIRRVIRQDQIEGGMVGIYNASITQRLNGLVDKSETEIKGGLNIPNLPDIGNR